MAQFIFKINEKKIELGALSNPILKRSFEQLKVNLEGQLATLFCIAHHREPMVFLHSHGSEAVLSGFGSCCQELNRRVKTLLRQQGYDVGQWTSKTRKRRFMM